MNPEVTKQSSDITRSRQFEKNRQTRLQPLYCYSMNSKMSSSLRSHRTLSSFDSLANTENNMSSSSTSEHHHPKPPCSPRKRFFRRGKKTDCSYSSDSSSTLTNSTANESLHSSQSVSIRFLPSDTTKQAQHPVLRETATYVPHERHALPRTIPRLCLLPNCQCGACHQTKHTYKTTQPLNADELAERRLGPIDVDALDATITRSIPLTKISSGVELQLGRNGVELPQERDEIKDLSEDSQPVDVDDYIPSDSYWAQSNSLVILDESEMSRGLAGYQAGFEPKMISDLSRGHCWSEDAEDELEETICFNEYTTTYAASPARSRMSKRSEPSEMCGFEV